MEVGLLKDETKPPTKLPSGHHKRRPIFLPSSSEKDVKNWHEDRWKDKEIQEDRVRERKDREKDKK